MTVYGIEKIASLKFINEKRFYHSVEICELCDVNYYVQLKFCRDFPENNRTPNLRLPSPTSKFQTRPR